jgi:hypothetical protein
MAVTTAQNPRISGVRLSASDPAPDGDQFAASTTYVLSTQARSLWINTAGDVYVDFVGGIEGRSAGTNIKFTCVAGSPLPVMVTKIYSTTTATGVILY